MGRVSYEELFRAFVQVLEAESAPYFLYGGAAVAVWGDPRETQDVDAVLVVNEPEADRILSALSSVGFYSSPERRTTLKIDGWIRMDFKGRTSDVALGKTDFDKCALSRRTRSTLFGVEAWIASAEDLLLYKLVSHRYRDLADVENVMLRQRRVLDQVYLRRWADEIAAHTGRFEVPQVLDKLLRRISEV